MHAETEARFVLDKLGQLNAGADPDAQHRPLPADLRGSLDLGRIGMFGHSLGGATTAQTMANNQRIIAGINLDGSFISDVDPHEAGPEVVERELTLLARRIGNRPFMIMASGGFGPDYFGNLTSIVWRNLRGWRRFLSITGSTHYTYTDLLPLLTQLAAAGVIPSAPRSASCPARPRSSGRRHPRLHPRVLRPVVAQPRLPSARRPSAQYPEVKFFQQRPGLLVDQDSTHTG